MNSEDYLYVMRYTVYLHTVQKALQKSILFLTNKLIVI